MSAEKPDNSNPAIGLTSDQAKSVIESIINKWDGKRGLRLDKQISEELIKKYGADAKISQILKDLNDPKNKI